jgi:hypothetical protein
VAFSHMGIDGDRRKGYNREKEARAMYVKT